MNLEHIYVANELCEWFLAVGHGELSSEVLSEMSRTTAVTGGPGFIGSTVVRGAAGRLSGATILGYHVSDPPRYGVVEVGHGGRVLSIEESRRTRSPTMP